MDFPAGQWVVSLVVVPGVGHNDIVVRRIFSTAAGIHQGCSLRCHLFCWWCHWLTLFYYSVIWESDTESSTHAEMLLLPSQWKHYSNRLLIPPSFFFWPPYSNGNTVLSWYVWLVSICPQDPGSHLRSMAVSNNRQVDIEEQHIPRWTQFFFFSVSALSNSLSIANLLDRLGHVWTFAF